MMKTVTLSLDKVAYQAAVPTGLHMTEARLLEDLVFDQVVVGLTGYVLSEHLASDTETATQKIPATWRDMLKVDLLHWSQSHPKITRPLRWWLNRHPAGMRTLELSVTWHRAATRPYSTIDVDRLGPVVYQERTDGGLRDYRA